MIIQKKYSDLFKWIVNLGLRIIVLLLLGNFIMKYCHYLIKINLWLMQVLNFSFTPIKISEMHSKNILSGEIFTYCMISGFIYIIILEIIITIINSICEKIKFLDVNKEDIKDSIVGVLETGVIVLIIFIVIIQSVSKFTSNPISDIDEAYQNFYYSVIIAGQLVIVNAWFKFECNFMGIGRLMLVRTKSKQYIKELEKVFYEIRCNNSKFTNDDEKRFDMIISKLINSENLKVLDESNKNKIVKDVIEKELIPMYDEFKKRDSNISQREYKEIVDRLKVIAKKIKDSI